MNFQSIVHNLHFTPKYHVFSFLEPLSTARQWPQLASVFSTGTFIPLYSKTQITICQCEFFETTSSCLKDVLLFFKNEIMLKYERHSLQESDNSAADSVTQQQISLKQGDFFLQKILKLIRILSYLSIIILIQSLMFLVTRK